MIRRLDDVFFDIRPPEKNGWLSRDAGHEIYWQVTGPETGIPILLIHGGPGGHCSDALTALFPAATFRIIQFDQRGCGRSRPDGALDANSLWHTLDDIEALRVHLGVDRWVVSGGSWGSTVALAYAQKYADRVMALMLVATWLLRREDMHWWLYGVRAVFPELWHEFASFIPASERNDLRRAYCRRILGSDTKIAEEAATRLYLYEEGIMHFDTPLVRVTEARGPAYGRMFAHYLQNNFFLEENQLLDQVSAIKDMPVWMVTGRYDMCTPPSNAHDLAVHLSKCRHVVVPGGGHYPTEPAMARACSAAILDLHQTLQRQGG